MSYRDAEGAVDLAVADLRAAELVAAAIPKELATVEHQLTILRESAAIVRALAREVQDSVKGQMESAVNQCLEAVFDEPYEFRVVFVEKRGKTEAELVFTREGEEIDPMTAAGGGVVDVVAFALRLASIIIDPRQPRVLVLDEPFKFVSRNYLPRVADLLEELAEGLGIQIIMVTHIPEITVGDVVRIS
jgi:DNA repair exonuclease SbcCD ATPase subunit